MRLDISYFVNTFNIYIDFTILLLYSTCIDLKLRYRVAGFRFPGKGLIFFGQPLFLNPITIKNKIWKKKKKIFFYPSPAINIKHDPNIELRSHDSDFYFLQKNTSLYIFFFLQILRIDMQTCKRNIRRLHLVIVHKILPPL